MATGGAALMIARNLLALQDGIKKAEEAWKDLSKIGLTLETEEMKGMMDRTASHTRPKLAGERSGVSVEVRIHSDMVHYGWTVVSGKRPDSSETKLGVICSPGGVLGYLRSLIGQDIEIGDEAFDAGYLITGKPDSFAKEILVPTVREHIVACGAKLAAYKIDGDTVSVTLHGVETDPEILGRAVDLCALGASFKS